MRNKARVAEAWLDPASQDRFYAKVQRNREQFDIGSLADTRALQRRLQCHGFDWFAKKFKGISPV